MFSICKGIISTNNYISKFSRKIKVA